MPPSWVKWERGTDVIPYDYITLNGRKGLLSLFAAAIFCGVGSPVPITTGGDPQNHGCNPIPLCNCKMEAGSDHDSEEFWNPSKVM